MMTFVDVCGLNTGLFFGAAPLASEWREFLSHGAPLTKRRKVL
jgi:hypothetical protein